jgi:hypothetical protein
VYDETSVVYRAGKATCEPPIDPKAGWKLSEAAGPLEIIDARRECHAVNVTRHIAVPVATRRLEVSTTRCVRRGWSRIGDNLHPKDIASLIGGAIRQCERHARPGACRLTPLRRSERDD